MYKSITLIVMMSFFLAACGGGNSSSGGMDVQKICWTHTTNIIEGINNLLTLCVEGNLGSLVVDFPNVSSVPTTCSQEGVKQDTSDGFVINFNEGPCENGRFIEGDTFSCVNSGLNLVCLTNRGDEYDFARINN